MVSNNVHVLAMLQAWDRHNTKTPSYQYKNSPFHSFRPSIFAEEVIIPEACLSPPLRKCNLCSELLTKSSQVSPFHMLSIQPYYPYNGNRHTWKDFILQQNPRCTSVSFGFKETWEYVPVRWQQGKCQLWEGPGCTSVLVDGTTRVIFTLHQTTYDCVSVIEATLNSYNKRDYTIMRDLWGIMQPRVWQSSIVTHTGKHR